jgi:uncharacterized protein
MRQVLIRYSRVILMALAFAVLVPSTAFALDVPQVPNDIPVLDQTGTLTDEQKNGLAAAIAKERSETGNQIGVLMINSLQGEVLEDYSLQVARQWGIGNKERDSGVLLLVAKADRKIRIEVGYGLEGALTDARSSRIIRDRIAPEFRENKYYEGLQSGLVGITTAIHGEKDTVLQEEAGMSLSSVPWELVLAGLFFIPTWLAAMLGRTKSWWAGGVIGAVAGVIVGFIFGFMVIGVISIIALTIIGLIFDKAVSANYRRHASQGDAPSWWAGGPYIGGGRNSSGGFGGFGGGGFGGGGSSGSW